MTSVLEFIFEYESNKTIVRIKQVGCRIASMKSIDYDKFNFF